MYTRKCPKCNIEITYSGKGAKSNCEKLKKLNKPCLKCSNLEKRNKYTGENNPFFGKKHTENFKLKLSNERIGKHYSLNTEFKKGRNPYNVKNNPKYSLSKILDNTNIDFYWLGFLLADGSFYKNTFEFSLQEKDKEQLQLFKKHINGPEIKQKKSSYRICFSNKENLQLFKSTYNINEKKTYNPPDFEIYKKLCFINFN